MKKNTSIAKTSIKVSSPGKLMLLGEHAVVYKRPCLVTTVDKRMTISAKLTQFPVVMVNSPLIGLHNYQIDPFVNKDKISQKVLYVETAITGFYQKFKPKYGLDIDIYSDLPSKFGFGSSASVLICVLQSAVKIFDIKLTKEEFFMFCHQVLLTIHPLSSGFDLAAEIYGGTIFFGNRGKMIKSLPVSKLPFLVVYTGIKADTSKLVKKVERLRNFFFERTEKIFDKIEEIVCKGKVALQNKQWIEFGHLMNLNQELLERLGVGGGGIRDIVQAAKKSGAYGVKLSGAGGGDCVIICCGNDKKEFISQAVSKFGTIIDVSLSCEGVRIEH